MLQCIGSFSNLVILLRYILNGIKNFFLEIIVMIVCGWVGSLWSLLFLQVNTHWRKIQDRLEDDERCSHLEKIDRLIVFQDYIRDLEKEEEEQKKIHKVGYIHHCSVFVYLKFLFFYDQIRNNWGGLSGKTVMSFASWWKSMLLMALLQRKLTGVIIVWRYSIAVIYRGTTGQGKL